jgi:anti-sigma regulatory factor (Ser/Thr protein kinase)
VGAGFDSRRRKFDLHWESVRAARSFVRELADGAGADAEAAALLASELAANAVIHAKSAFEVRVAEQGKVLRVEIVNDAPEMLAALREPSDGSGRGLHIVDALASRWGTDVMEREKVVWFELPTRWTGRGGSPGEPSFRP